nr:hypothetical protein [Tanacetum cinerariifolium]
VMSTLIYVDSKTITQAGGVQSSRVPISLHDDPYVAIRQAHLIDTDTESELEEAPSEAEESQSLGIDPHIRHHHLWPFLHERGFGVTSELVLDTKTEDESSDLDAKREGHGLDDEGHGLEDEGPGSEERGLHLRVSSRVYTAILTYPPVAPVENRHLLSDRSHAAMQRELQEMRGLVAILEQERGRRDRVPLCVVKIFGSLCRDFYALCRDLFVRLSSSVEEELRALRDRLDVDEAERATLRATVRRMGASKTVLRNRMRDERQTRIKIERQLALVQEELKQSMISHCQDQEDFKKLKDFMTSELGYHP